MLLGIYKDTRLTLTETFLLSFLSPTLNMVLFAEALLEAITQGIYDKITLLKVKTWHSSFIEEQLSTVSCLWEKPETLRRKASS